MHNEIDSLRNEQRDFRNELHAFNSELHKKLFHDLTDLIQRSISTSILHQKTFSRFKNSHQGQEIVLVACGPTAKEYKRIDGAIHIGVNRAFQIEDIDLQYLFIQDYRSLKHCIKEANSYKPASCIKFYGHREITSAFFSKDWEVDAYMPECDVIEANALHYRIFDIDTMGCRFSHFIDIEPLGAFQSIVFPAMQFALWTNPRRIYLVGCDCTEGYFDGQPSAMSSNILMPHWVLLKKFARMCYPETEILSINPVGLLGIFDEDQRQC